MESDSGDDETGELREFGWEECKNDQDAVDRMRQKVYSKGKGMLRNERSVIFKEKDDCRERVTEDEERVSI